MQTQRGMNRGERGCWHIWRWIIVPFQTCTICRFVSGLQPSHSSHTELLGWGVGSPRHPRFSVAHNNGPHSGSTTHLALSDKWFWKRTHTALSPASSKCAQTHHCPLLYTVSTCVWILFPAISLTLDTKQAWIQFSLHKLLPDVEKKILLS